MSMYSQIAKNFLILQNFGVLSSISVSQGGYPFGSVVPYSIDEESRFIIYISLIAEHYKNLSSDPRASLTVIDPLGIHDPQAHPRATVLLKFAEVPTSAQSGILTSYLKSFPNPIDSSISGNFRFFIGSPERIRWIGGFGDVGWVEGEAYRLAEKDPMVYEQYRMKQSS